MKSVLLARGVEGMRAWRSLRKHYRKVRRRAKSDSAADRHGRLSMDELLDLGCTCEFGCRQCEEPLARMGNCPGWNDCPIGREPDPDCRLSRRRVRMELSDGGYMDTTIATDASPETMAALRALGEATLAHMKAGD